MGDGYTAAEMDKWHADAKRLAEILFAASPFKERRRDFNVWAVDTPSDESGVARPSDGVFRRSRAARGVRRVRLRALRAGVRQQADARGRRGRALRVHRDRGERPQVRRRRHPQPLRDRLRRQRVHAVRVRARVRPSLRRPRRRVLHVGGRVREHRRTGPSRGSRTRPRTRRRRKWKDLVAAGTPLPTPWEKEDVRGEPEGLPGEAPADPRGQAARDRDGGAVREEREQSTARAGAGPARAGGGRLRGRDVRGDRATTGRRRTA